MANKMTDAERNRLINRNTNLESEIAVNNITLLNSHKMNEAEMKEIASNNLKLGNEIAINDSILWNYTLPIGHYQINQEEYHLFGNRIRHAIRVIKDFISEYKREYRINRLENPEKGKLYSLIDVWRN